MFILAFTGPYGEEPEILREMFFWLGVPPQRELIVAPKATFLTLASSRKREREDSSLLGACSRGCPPSIPTGLRAQELNLAIERSVLNAILPFPGLG